MPGGRRRSRAQTDLRRRCRAGTGAGCRDDVARRPGRGRRRGLRGRSAARQHRGGPADPYRLHLHRGPDLGRRPRIPALLGPARPVRAAAGAGVDDLAIHPARHVPGVHPRRGQQRAGGRPGPDPGDRGHPRPAHPVGLLARRPQPQRARRRPPRAPVQLAERRHDRRRRHRLLHRPRTSSAATAPTNCAASPASIASAMASPTLSTALSRSPTASRWPPTARPSMSAGSATTRSTRTRSATTAASARAGRWRH